MYPEEKFGGSPSLLECIGTGGCCSPLFASFVKLPASEFKEVVPARGDLLQGQCFSGQKLVLLGHRLSFSIDRNYRVRRWLRKR
jgi:hypothetical protein